MPLSEKAELARYGSMACESFDVGLRVPHRWTIGPNAVKCLQEVRVSQVRQVGEESCNSL